MKEISLTDAELRQVAERIGHSVLEALEADAETELADDEDHLRRTAHAALAVVEACGSLGMKSREQVFLLGRLIGQARELFVDRCVRDVVEGEVADRDALAEEVDAELEAHCEAFLARHDLD